jgi:hypothetical protein
MKQPDVEGIRLRAEIHSAIGEGAPRAMAGKMVALCDYILALEKKCEGPGVKL